RPGHVSRTRSLRLRARAGGTASGASSQRTRALRGGRFARVGHDLHGRGSLGMARIAGVNIPPQKRLEIGLTYIFGIGQPTSRKVCAALGLSPDTKVRDLTDAEVTQLQRHIDAELEVEGDLRRERQQAIKRLQEIGSYRGVRHRRGLPVHGQRTKTNARSRKGPKKTVGRGKKAA